MTSPFRRMPFGYSTKEVDEHIAALKAELDKLREEMEGYAKKIEEQNAEIEKYREKERFITNTLVDAQTQAVEIRQKAQDSYDQTILRLSDESKVWENRIAKNRDKLIALDSFMREMIQDLHEEMVGAVTAAGENVKDYLPKMEHAALSEGKTEEPALKREEEAKPVQTPVKNEKTPEEAAEKKEPVSSDEKKDELDISTRELYWKLRNIGREEEEEERDRGMYLPDEAERTRLENLCKELGLLDR